MSSILVSLYLAINSLSFGLQGTKGKVSADVYQKVQNLCSLCDGPEDDKCAVSSSDYHKEAFKCMKDGKGDVAFVKIEMDSPKPFYDEANKTAYQYLCANGGRMGNVCITNILFEVW